MKIVYLAVFANEDSILLSNSHLQIILVTGPHKLDTVILGALLLGPVVLYSADPYQGDMD